MKAEVLENPLDETEPSIRIIADTPEEQTILWFLAAVGPKKYDVEPGTDTGDAKVDSILLVDKS